MIDALKCQIRSWERDSRYEWLTDAATFGWVSMNNLMDWTKIGRVTERLVHGDFPDDVDAAVSEVCLGSFGAGIRPMQVPTELAGLISLIDAKKPKSLLEIGTARGGTLLLMSRFAAADATIVSVDLPYGRNGGGYPKWKDYYYRLFALPEQKLHLMRANSHDPATLECVRNALDGEQLDFILIDGDHSYNGVKRDYENYRPLLAPGGILALHDVLPNAVDPSIDVHRFWAELVSDPSIKADMIVDDPNQGMYGIGIIYG